MRRSLCLLAAGLSLAAGSASAFMPTPQAGGFAGATRRAGVPRPAGAAARVGGASEELRRRRARLLGTVGRGRVTMDTEASHVQSIKNGEQWNEIVAAAGESGMLLVVLFKKDFCRKCAAMKPKFAKVALRNIDRQVMWAEVDGVKLGKDLREQLKLEKVPTFQVWGRGQVLEHFEAESDLTATVRMLETVVDRHAGVSDPPADLSDASLLEDLSRASQEMGRLGSQRPGVARG